MNQKKALAILKSGKNVFLTGSAGAGKTYVLNQYIQYLKARKVPVAITASTGIAATHMNGQTIHSWAGIGVKDSLSSNDLRRLKEKQYLVNKITTVEVLIIDDNATSLKIMRKICDSLDFKTTSLTSQEEAVEMLKKKEIAPDIIVLDYLMPGLNGIELIKSMKKQKLLKKN